MKKLLFSSLILLSVAVAAPAKSAELTPSNLVFQGYQGRLKSEGIAGYGTFRQGIHLGKIDAETLIQGAIAQGKLDANKANDASYIQQVKSYLFIFKANDSGR